MENNVNQLRRFAAPLARALVAALAISLAMPVANASAQAIKRPNILLAIAYVREHDKPHARELLASLRDKFPANPLFAQEIARLDSER